MSTFTDTLTVQLVLVTCYKCGVIFGVERTMQRSLCDSHDSFFCPNGHSQHYLGEALEQRHHALDEAYMALKAERDALRAALGVARADCSHHHEKWQEYERDYILPCFHWAEACGIDLRALVRDNAGRNCVYLLVDALRAALAAAAAEREARIQHQTAMADQLDLATERLLFLADWFSDGGDLVILHDHPEAGDHEHLRWQTVKLDGKPVRALLVMDGYGDPEEDRNESLNAALDAVRAVLFPGPATEASNGTGN